MIRSLSLVAIGLLALAGLAKAGELPAGTMRVAKAANAAAWTIHTPSGTATAEDLVFHVKARVFGDSAQGFEIANAIATRLVIGNMDTMTPAQRSAIPWVIFTARGPDEVRCIGMNFVTSTITTAPVPSTPPVSLISRSGFESGCNP